MKNIIFIGMPASGKSTVGVVIAKRLGLGFVDTDLLIQAQEKKLLKEIIAEVGNEGFLAIENQVKDLKQQLFTLRFQHATGQLENPNELKKIRKTIARMLTVLEQRKAQ